MTTARSRLWRLAVIGHGLAVALAIFWLLDRFKDHAPERSSGERVPMPSDGAAPTTARVYVLIIDSLRYETAMDPAIMPALARLRAEGVHAWVANIHNAVTVPSLWTIFTGVEQVRLLAVVDNFINVDRAGADSVFAQLRGAGGRAIVSARDELHPFAAQVAEVRRRPSPYVASLDEAQLLEAADALARGEANLVVGHLAYTDHAAHRYGIDRLGYRQAFARADRLVAALRARLPAGAVFAVLGDHGHTPDGRHSLGLSTPTLAVYAGPPFRAGLDLGPIHLASNRYLLNAALGLPLAAEGYRGEWLPRALRAFDPAQAASYAPAGASGYLPPPELRSAWGRARLALYCAVLAAAWLILAVPEWRPGRMSGWRLGAAWLAPLGALLPLGWGLNLGLALGVAALWPSSGVRWAGLRPAGLVVAGLGFVGWGGVLAAGIEAVPLPEVSTLHLVWAAVLVTGAVLATRRNRGVIAWGVFALPALLLVPTNYRYGWSSAAAPALIGWAIFYAITVVRERRQARAPFPPSEWAALAGLAGLIGLLAQVVMTGEGSAYVFAGWHALIPGWTTSDPGFALLAGPLAGFILLCDRPEVRRVRLGALALAVLLYPLQVRLWPLDSPVWPALIAAVASAWAVARWRREVTATMLGRWTGLALWAWWMRPPEPNHAAVCCLLAALVVAGRLMRRFPQPEWARADRALLLAIGAVAVGHAICRWSIEDLEWRAAYDWFGADAVERGAWLVLIWVLAKGLAPWLVMQEAVMTASGPAAANPEPLFRAALGTKAASALLLMAGLGLMPEATAAYLEAAQQATVLAILTFYLLLFPP